LYQPGKVNRRNASICGSKKPCIDRHVVQDSSKANIRCGLMEDRANGPLFFVQATVTGDVFLHMEGHFVYPRQWICSLTYTYGLSPTPPPPHIHTHTHTLYFALLRSPTITFPDRWIKCNKPIYRQPCLPDIASLDLVLWGYVKRCVYAVRVHINYANTGSRDKIY
jgi:hypothetical protein